MLVGINYPWIDYGWDFGGPPPAWVADESLPAWRESKRKQIEKDFSFFASQGIFAVRWFLLGDGLNYGTGVWAPWKTGESWTFDPLPVGHSYYSQLCDDFEFVLRVCRENGLRLFPSLIDFHWCRQGILAAEDPVVIKGGRRDIVCNPEKRQLFFDRILEPLLALSMRYQDSIYAWEIINEPEWVMREVSPFGVKDPNRTVTHDEMKKFIAEGIQRVNGKRLPDGRSAFPSSAGFAHWESIEKWDAVKLGITLHQFHYYAQQDGSLPVYSDLQIHPCVVGEFATAGGRDWPDLKFLCKDQTVSNRLSCIEDKGYPACIMWSARAVDLATRWTEEEQRQVLAYTRSILLKRPESKA